MTLVVGLLGYAQSGKDTAGAILVEEYGFTRLAFADILRDVLYEINPLVECNVEHEGGVATESLWEVQGLVDIHGWEYAKANGPEGSDYTVRTYLQRLGTEGGRKHLGENVWVDATMAKIDAAPFGSRFVITDVRFPNEVNAVHHRGVSWRVVRPGYGPVNGHASETAIDGVEADLVIHNSTSREAFENAVRRAALGFGRT